MVALLENTIRGASGHQLLHLLSLLRGQVLPYETIHERSNRGYSRHTPLKRLLEACAREGRKVLLFAPQKTTPKQLQMQLTVLLKGQVKVCVLVCAAGHVGVLRVGGRVLGLAIWTT